MPISPDVMQVFLILSVLGMALFAYLYLRRRELTFLEYLRWGLIIVLLPLVGPFLMILALPGKARKSHSHLNKFR
jgi:hypothetical protein